MSQTTSPWNTRTLNDPTSVMALSEIECANGMRIGVAVLNSEKTLNSLSLPMIEILAPQLDRWERDAGIAMLLIHGAGDRAFAAGGDIQDLYHAIRKNQAAGAWIDNYPDRFFATEYALDQRLLTFSKPILTWGHGFVMGGGLGIFSAGSHRVVTEKARLAMPEVTIGLFPDAGGTWMLRGIEKPLALWVGLTGLQLSAADALFLKIADFGVAHEKRAEVLAVLAGAQWKSEATANRQMLGDVLRQFEARPDVTTSLMAKHRDRIAAAAQSGASSPAALVAAFAALKDVDEWCGKAIATMQRGCATTIAIIVEQIERAASLTLEQCFDLELSVARRCAREREFAEGVRALLIDKDQKPVWRFSDVASVPRAHVLKHFDHRDESFP